MINKSLGFIGGGRVTRIILEGFHRKGIEFPEVVASDIDPAALARIRDIFPGIRTAHNDNTAPAGCDLVFLALHPPACPAVLDEIKGSLKPGAALVSLAPKITMDRMSERLGGFSRIARMIPNAPSIVGAGYNPVVFSPALGREEREHLHSLFSALGECPEVPEKDLEAYAVLAAMGPTYFWFQWEELEALGAGFGLDREVLRKALSAMIEGAGRTYFSSGLAGPEVMDLIPVKPLKDDEEGIRDAFRKRLVPLYEKIRP
ncbi:MAG: NAD(P)-binding domain-containing protein [Acidobacteriota bacterium]|nr:NAD(P)-binding domain-containing protein [Acidobacteriota bacterium]